MRILLLHPAANNDLATSPVTHCTTRHPGENWDILIRWGITDGPDAPFTYNASWALQNAADTEACRSLLRLNRVPHRMPSNSKAVLWMAEFRIHIVDLHSVQVLRLRNGREIAVENSPPRHHNTLETLARRALLALGLHFGSVHIGIDRRGKPCVLHIDPAPSVDEHTLKLYRHALSASIETLVRDATVDPKERNAMVLLGADPEFVVLRRHNGALRYASDLFPFAGSVGFDRQSCTIQGERRHPIAEIRPPPTSSPHALVASIRDELIRAYQMAPDLNAEWFAGAYPYPGHATGGHIHFSGLRPTTFLLRALDTYLAIPSLLLEDAVRATKRRRRYGLLGEFRHKDHGGFEYRTLSSWLSGMQRARTTLAIAKLVAVEYPRLTRHLLHTPARQRAFYNGRKSAFRNLVDTLWRDMEKTHSYEENSQDLDRTRIWIHDRRQWRESRDLKHLWHIH